MQHTIQAAEGRELHRSINPALAGFDRALRRECDAVRRPSPSVEDELCRARARAVIARTRLAWA